MGKAARINRGHRAAQKAARAAAGRGGPAANANGECSGKPTTVAVVTADEVMGQLCGLAREAMLADSVENLEHVEMRCEIFGLTLWDLNVADDGGENRDGPSVMMLAFEEESEAAFAWLSARATRSGDEKVRKELAEFFVLCMTTLSVLKGRPAKHRMASEALDAMFATLAEAGELDDIKQRGAVAFDEDAFQVLMRVEGRAMAESEQEALRAAVSLGKAASQTPQAALAKAL